VAFFVIHIAQVIRAGWANFRAIVCGYDLVDVDIEQQEAEVTHAD
jgi:hypothetical protein